MGASPRTLAEASTTSRGIRRGAGLAIGLV
jgi:hypothetical protein